MTDSNIPTYRPAGSPLARAHGATNPDGTPVRNVVRKSASRSAPQTNTSRGISPNERAGVAPVTKSAAQQAQTLEALRRAFNPPQTRRVRKAIGTPQVAVYDALGNLLGTTDQSAIAPLSSGTPAQPAPVAPVAPVDDQRTGIGDPLAQAVAKALRRRPAARTRVAKALTKNPAPLRFVARGRRGR